MSAKCINVNVAVVVVVIRLAYILLNYLIKDPVNKIQSVTQVNPFSKLFT